MIKTLSEEPWDRSAQCFTSSSISEHHAFAATILDVENESYFSFKQITVSTLPHSIVTNCQVKIESRMSWKPEMGVGQGRDFRSATKLLKRVHCRVKILNGDREYNIPNLRRKGVCGDWKDKRGPLPRSKILYRDESNVLP